MEHFKFIYIYISNVLNNFNNISIIFRILLSITVGTIIGLDRETKKHSAGVRTHAFVCLGANLTILLGLFLYYEYDKTIDISRIGAQVISGIGFLGVGTIITSQNKFVRGLTTASSLWTTATIGLCIGAGFYFGAIFGTIIAVFLLKYLERMDIVLRKKVHIRNIYIECNDIEAIELIENILKLKGLYMFSFDTKAPKVPENIIGIDISINSDLEHSTNDIINEIRTLKQVAFVHRIYL